MKLQQIFNRFGVLEILVSDNGAVLLQQKFQISAKTMAFKYVRTLPFHPQSNGKVERFVDTFKTQRRENYNRNYRNIFSKL